MNAKLIASTKVLRVDKKSIYLIRIKLRYFFIKAKPKI